MRKVFLFIPLIGLLSGCQNTTVRGYSVRAMPGLTSPFTKNCTSIRLQAGGNDETVSLGDSDNVFFGHPNPGPTTVMAQCLAMIDGQLVKTGSSEAKVDANAIEVYIGSSEGSTIADDFAKIAKTSGTFPIVQ